MFHRYKHKIYTVMREKEEIYTIIPFTCIYPKEIFLTEKEKKKGQLEEPYFKHSTARVSRLFL